MVCIMACLGAACHPHTGDSSHDDSQACPSASANLEGEGEEAFTCAACLGSLGLFGNSILQLGVIAALAQQCGLQLAVPSHWKHGQWFEQHPHWKVGQFSCHPLAEKLTMRWHMPGIYMGRVVNSCATVMV